jgi:hypothetical protein
MERDYLYEFEQGVGALEDLGRLTGHDFSPVIIRAYHHFSEMKRKAREKIEFFPPESSIRLFLEKSVQQLWQEFKVHEKKIAQLDLVMNAAELTLIQWNRLLDCISIFMNIVRALPFCDNCSVTLDQDGISFKGNLLKDSAGEMQNKRVEIYALLRQTLRKEAPVTFELNSDGAMELFLDLRHRDDRIYLVELPKPINLKIAFSSILEGHRVSSSKLDQLGRHFCLEINSQGVLRKYDQIPEHFEEELVNKEIIHFHFLFRPISLIIPGRGEILSTNDPRLAGDTGSDHLVPTTLSLSSRPVYHYVDLFSLLANS